MFSINPEWTGTASRLNEVAIEFLSVPGEFVKTSERGG